MKSFTKILAPCKCEAFALHIKILIATGLIISLSALFGAQTVFADPPRGSTAGLHDPDVPRGGFVSPDTSPTPTPPGPPAPPPIPDTFNVNTYLQAPGQTSFVPTNAAEANGNDKGIVGVVIKAIDLLVKVTASLALIVFIIGALLTMVSEGKEDRLEKGKNAMVYSLIGLVITGFAFIIVAFVQSILFQ